MLDRSRERIGVDESLPLTRDHPLFKAWCGGEVNSTSWRQHLFGRTHLAQQVYHLDQVRDQLLRLSVPLLRDVLQQCDHVVSDLAKVVLQCLVIGVDALQLSHHVLTVIN